MNKILYCIYVGTCRIRVKLPLTMVNYPTISAPPSPNNTNRPVRQAFSTWLDDIYLTPIHTASCKRSRFTESDNFPRLSHTTTTPRRHDLPAPPFNHNSVETILGAFPNISTIFYKFTTINPRSTRLLHPPIRRITRFIVMLHLSVWPPPTLSLEKLIHQDLDEILPQYILAIPSPHAYVRSTYFTWLLIIHLRNYTSTSHQIPKDLSKLSPPTYERKPMFLARSRIKTVFPTPPHPLPTHFYKKINTNASPLSSTIYIDLTFAMPSKRTVRAPRKSPPELNTPAPIAPYPPPGRHPSEPTILAFPSNQIITTTTTKTGQTRTKSLSTRSQGTMHFHQRGRSAGPVKRTQYPIFAAHQNESIASTSSLTTTSSSMLSNPQVFDDPQTRPLSNLTLSPTFTDDANLSQPTTNENRQESCPSRVDNPYINASEMRKAIRDQNNAAAAADKTRAELYEARRQRAFYADKEARLSILASASSFDEEMEDCEEEFRPHRAAKKTNYDGRTSSNQTSESQYLSPARKSSTSHKRNQVSSPSTHYALQPIQSPGTTIATYFEKGGEAEQDLQATISRADSITRHYSHTVDDTGKAVSFPHVPRPRAVARKKVGQGTPYPQARPPETPLTCDTEVEDEDEDESLGHGACGTSPLAPIVPIRPSLRTSSFAPVILPSPPHATTVHEDPDFFEGASLPGSGPGPHFITVSFIKNAKDKIRDQLLLALSTTITILSQNIPGVLLHCITKSSNAAPLDSATSPHFPTSGVGARNYMFISNPWSLTPGTRNKLKLPAAKVGTNGRPLFDENRGYDGPDRIVSVLWMTCNMNAKDAIDDLQLELEGESLQIRWKPAQKKNTKSQIVIYGIPPFFDPNGIMSVLLHGLKASEKEICDSTSTLPFEARDARRDLPLPLMNGYFKQAIPPKAVSHSEGKETSLNRNKEYTQNGCRVFHLEFDPCDNERMSPVWTHFRESGKEELVLGRRAKVYVVPSAGRATPTKIIEVRRYMNFHLKYTTITRTHSHPTVSCLDKMTEVTMEDKSARPPRKFTSMRQEYMDLRTPDNLEVFHAVIPRSTSIDRETSVDCLYMVKNTAARDFSLKIQVCPSAWWYHVFRKFRGYSESTTRSLLGNFEIEAAALADQSNFDLATMTVSTQFADTDDFLDRAEAELGFSDDDSDNDIIPIDTSIEMSDNAKASLAASLLKKDNDFAANSHASAKSRRSTFSCSTGNDTNRSINTAKFAMINKTRALELASERKKSADLEANQRIMARRIQELEASFSNSSPVTSDIPSSSNRRSVRISELPPLHPSSRTDIEHESMETEEAEFIDSEMDSHHSTTDNITVEELQHPRTPSKTNHSANNADDLNVLDGSE